MPFKSVQKKEIVSYKYNKMCTGFIDEKYTILMKET